jgi:hypothetical protein
MSRIDPYKKVYTASFNWNVNTPAGTIIPILYNDPALLKASEPLLPDKFTCNAYLTDLYTIERAYSLPSIDIPNYTDEDTRRQRTLKTQQMQWSDARFDANFFVCGKKPPLTNNDWVFIGTIPILNTQGFKYTRHRPIDLLTHNLARPFGEFASLGLQIETIAYPLTSIDRISIDASWHQESPIVQPDFAPVLIETAATITAYSDSTTLTISTANRQIFPSRPTRFLLTVTNSSTTATVYISTTGSVPTATSNDGSVGPLGTKDFPNATGTINAVASAATTPITVRERYNQ